MFAEKISTKEIEIPEPQINLSTSYPENILNSISIGWGSPGINFLHQKGAFIISADISLPIQEFENRTFEGKIPKEITPYQAYEIAINTLKSYENRWEEFLLEEARYLSFLDEENEN